MSNTTTRFFLAPLAGLALLASAQAQGLGLRAGTGTALGRPTPVIQQADYIVAVVNSEPITNQEVQARVARAAQQLAQQGGGTPPPREELTRVVLERLISEKAQLQLAREMGVRVNDAAVDQAELTVASQNQLDRAEFRQRLAREGIPLARMREDLRNQLILQRLRERELEPQVRVSDADVDQFLREQAGAQGAGTQEINLATVLIAVPENGSEAQVAALKARAEQVAARARAGEDFATLVREYSDAFDRNRNGGEMGLRSVNRYPPLFLEATQSLRVGEIAGPVRSGAGFHILKVIDKRQGGAAMTVTQTHARHILLRTSATQTEAAARARLADFKRRIETRQADFAALARDYSQDGSARDGGDLGWVGPGQFVPEFEEVMNRLSPGQVSDPLVSRFGVHLIQVLERRDAALNPQQMRELARAQLREKKLDEAYANWAQEVRGRAYVEYREPPQ